MKGKLKLILSGIVVLVGAFFGVNLATDDAEQIQAALQQTAVTQEQVAEDCRATLAMTGSGDAAMTDADSATADADSAMASELDENGSFYSKDEVGLYIYTYNKLPKNFIKKAEARKLGWEGGSVEDYAPGKAIGGDRFYNNEGTLPEKQGRVYTECDIDTLGKKSRGAKRIVFSDDGLIYYTNDHYETFELLYGNSQ